MCLLMPKCLASVSILTEVLVPCMHYLQKGKKNLIFQKNLGSKFYKLILEW